MLTKAQIDEYNEIGAIVVPDVLTPDEVRRLSDVTDGFVDRARGVTSHTEIYDLEDSHTPEQPRVRRIKTAHLHDPAYAALSRHPKIIAVLQALWGPDIRFDTAKLNMKCAGFGAPVEWHQDWAFYPHTNDNLAAVGVMFDDMAMENGPLMIIPGSHRGPTFDHHANGEGKRHGEDHTEHERASPALERGCQIGPQHIHRAMRQVDQVHDAEHERQSGGHQEQHDAELNAVEHLFNEQRGRHSLDLLETCHALRWIAASLRSSQRRGGRSFSRPGGRRWRATRDG